MSNIRMSPDQLDAKSKFFDAKSQEIETLMGQVASEVGDLASGFEGQTAQAFEEQMQQIKDGPLKDIKEILFKLGSQLTSIKEGMMEVDSDFGRQIRQNM